MRTQPWGPPSRTGADELELELRHARSAFSSQRRDASSGATEAAPALQTPQPLKRFLGSPARASAANRRAKKSRRGTHGGRPRSGPAGSNPRSPAGLIEKGQAWIQHGPDGDQPRRSRLWRGEQLPSRHSKQLGPMDQAGVVAVALPEGLPAPIMAVHRPQAKGLFQQRYLATD